MGFSFEPGKGTNSGHSEGLGSNSHQAGLPTVRLHDLRHSFASQAINGGASLYLTGAVLGHRQSSTTQRYAHLQSDPVRSVASRAAENIADMLQRKT